MIFRIAARNIVRHRRRSILTVLAVVACFSLLLVTTGLADGAHEQMIDMGVRMGLGDVIVYGQGYLDDPSLDRLVPDAARVTSGAKSLGDRVVAVAPRLRADVLVQAGASSVGAVLCGVEPGVEARASKIGSPESIVEGQPLSAGPTAVAHDLAPLVMGRMLAKTLGVRLGDRVTLTLRPVGGGEMTTAAFRVQGIFATGVHDVDAFWVETPLDAAQKLAGAGDGVSMVAVLLRSANDAGAVRDALDRALSGAPVDVVSWQKAAPELYSTIVLDEGGMYLTVVIVFIVVAAGILNTILMSVLERTREFGVMLALGAPPRRIVALVIVESLLLGVVAVGLGLAIGVSADHYFATVGLSVKGALGSGVEASGILIPERLFSHLSFLKLSVSTCVVAAIVVAGAVYPAMLAARLQPVEAMRHV